MRAHASSDLRRGCSVAFSFRGGENSAGRGPSQASQVGIEIGLTSVQAGHGQASGFGCAGCVGFVVAIRRGGFAGASLVCASGLVLVFGGGFVSVGSVGGSSRFLNSASMLACCARRVFGDSGGAPIARIPLGFSWLGGT
jgi:hypothetical protein